LPPVGSASSIKPGKPQIHPIDQVLTKGTERQKILKESKAAVIQPKRAHTIASLLEPSRSKPLPTLNSTASKLMSLKKSVPPKSVPTSKLPQAVSIRRPRPLFLPDPRPQPWSQLQPISGLSSRATRFLKRDLGGDVDVEKLFAQFSVPVSQMSAPLAPAPSVAAPQSAPQSKHRFVFFFLFQGNSIPNHSQRLLRLKPVQNHLP